MERGRNNMRPQSGCNLRNHARELDDLLRRECNKVRKELGDQLEAAKQEVAHQKSIKEDVIKKEKAARAELERLQRSCDPETLNIDRFATVVRSTLKTKKKKVLQKEYEDLKVALMISEEKSAAELQILKERNSALQQELDQLKASPATEELLAEKDALIQTLQENASVTERRFSKQMEELEIELHCAEGLSVCQEEQIKQLTTDLERQTESVQEQVEKNLQLRKANVILELDLVLVALEKQMKLGEEQQEDSLHVCQEQVTELQVEQEVSESLSIELDQPEEEQQEDSLHVSPDAENLQLRKSDAILELDLILDDLDKHMKDTLHVSPDAQNLPLRKSNAIPELDLLLYVLEKQMEDSLHVSPNAEVLESTKDSRETKSKKSSRWKRFRHFIGLRKRNKKVEKST